jgi:hypothetical protein
MLRGIHHGRITCSKLLDESRGAKLQWLHDTDKMNGGNQNSARCEIYSNTNPNLIRFSTLFQGTKVPQYFYS